MKTLRSILVSATFALLAGVASALFIAEMSGCQTAPSARVEQVKTLKIVGASVDATMKVAAQLYHDGKISAEVWGKIAAIHDTQFQPAFNFAVQAVQADVSSVASPDLVTLSLQLAALIAPYLEK